MRGTKSEYGLSYCVLGCLHQTLDLETVIAMAVGMVIAAVMKSEIAEVASEQERQCSLAASCCLQGKSCVSR